MRKLRVALTQRGSLADILRGHRGLHMDTVEIDDQNPDIKLRTNEVGVGYLDGHPDRLPHFLVVSAAERRDFFAWVNTYCSFVTPLSQWCRVVSENEFQDLRTLAIVPTYGRAIAAWAGAIIGEALLHNGTGAKVPQISISALQSCNLFVAARASGLWHSANVRLSTVERYERARDILGVGNRIAAMLRYEVLWPVLDHLSEDISDRIADQSLPIRMAIQCCMDIRKTGFVSEKIMSSVALELGWPREVVTFEKSGAEERISLFDSAVERLVGASSNVPHARTALVELIVAYFAARIGGGSSEHVKLLDRMLHGYPMVAVWYGVVSGLHRPEVWGAEFGGLARLAVRELSFPFRFDDPPRCDVAFDELDVLVDRGVERNALRFRGATRKALSVEVASGVTGTISLTGVTEQESSPMVSEIDQRVVSELLRDLGSATEKATRLMQAGLGQRPARPDANKGPKRKNRVKGRRDGDRAKGNSGQLDLE